MGHFYKWRVDEGDGGRCFVTIKVDAYTVREVEAPREVCDLLDDLQREYWRLERRESRHAWHLEDMSEGDIPGEGRVETPEQALMRQVERTELREALESLPLTARRRFLLHHLEGVPVKVLARLDGCSDRAIKYSLALARKRLREFLSEAASPVS